MTLTMVFAIIAAMLFGVFCALCLYAVFKNQKDVEKNENRMQSIENKLGSMAELINDRTEMLESKINEPPISKIYSDMIDVNPSYPYDIPAEGTESSINISDLMSDDFEDLLVDEDKTPPDKSLEEDEVLSAFMDSFKAFEQEVTRAEINEAKSPGEQQATVVSEAPVVQEASRASERLVVQDEPEIPAIQNELEVPEILRRPGWERRPEKPAEIQAERNESNSFTHHIGHDVGRSGKKYTAAELEQLIRE